MRVRDTVEAFGAPLNDIVRACRERGFNVSRSGVYNLFLPPRKNSTSSSCRSTLPIRPASVIATEKKWHPRARWSGHQMRLAKEFVHAVHVGRLGHAEQVHVDQMSKTPIWIPAAKRGRVGQCL